jgi:alpha-glucoside transport system substrate-binding protein
MKTRRGAFSALCIAGLLIAACGSDGGGSSSATNAGGTTAPAGTTAAGGTGAPAAAGDSLLGGTIKCEQQYKGKEVHIFSPVRDSGDTPAATELRNAYAPLEACTGLKVTWDGTDQFETEVKVRINGGNPPDVVDFPQPGGFLDLVNKGKLFAFPDNLAKAVNADNVGGWPELATVGGKVYGVPSRANVKSFVWYSPADFKAKGYAIPKTLDELKTLSDKIVTDGGTPWCAGVESGVATGWPITDWFEDFMLRINGPDVYDQWVQHKIPFDDPKVKAVADAVGSYLKNAKYIGGGDNGIKAIATTKFQEGGYPILDHKCYMHRQASFYASIWPKGTTIGPDGQVDSFYLPVAKTGDKKVMLGGGDLIGAGTNKPETFDTLLYTESSAYYLGIVGKDGKPDTGTAGLSTRKDFDTTKLTDPVQKAFADQLKSSDVFRFDGSDMMPAAIGSGAFWKEATAWIVGGSTDAMLKNIETAWKAVPAS